MASWFDKAHIDARGSTFTNISGDQVNYINTHPHQGNTYTPPGAPQPPPPNWSSADGPPSFMPNHPDRPFWANQRNNGAPSSQDTPHRLSNYSTTSSSRFTIIPDTLRTPSAEQSSLQSLKTSSLPPAETSSFSPPDIFQNFPHTLNLIESDPNLKLDDCLSRFETDVSPWEDPLNWLRSEADNLVHTLSKLSEKRGKTLEYAEAAFPVDNMMVYTRSIVYLYVHLGHCRADDKPFTDFKKNLQEWKQWDSIQILQNSRAIGDYLVELFRKYLQLPKSILRRLQSGHPKGEPKAQYHLEATLKSIMKIDAIRLAACVSVAVMDKRINNQILSLRDEAAQSLLDLLQARLDIYVRPSFKARHRKALIKLAKESKLYPESLVLHDIEVEPDAVASGGFGEVHKGKLKGREVAAKMLKVYRDTDMNKLLKDFSAEAVIWRQLSHPNVLHFYGVYRLKEKHGSGLYLVCPWMKNGNMTSYLKDNEYTPRIPLMQDIAEGLKYLHGENIVHGDLKGVNILISSSGRACLADFGLTTIRDSSPEMTNHFNSATRRSTGTLRWQAPELFGYDDDEELVSNTKATDIYAYAMVCWEIFYGIPWLEKKNEISVLSAVRGGKRPERPNAHDHRLAIPDDVWKIIVSCWDQNPKNRPAATEVVEQLRALPGACTHQPHFDDEDLISSTQIFKETYHPFSSLFLVAESMQCSMAPSDPSDDESMSTGV